MQIRHITLIAIAVLMLSSFVASKYYSPPFFWASFILMGNWR